MTYTEPGGDVVQGTTLGFMKARTLSLYGALALVLSGAATANAGTTGELIYGVTSTFNLVTFNSTSPSSFLSSVAISGVVAGQTLRAIDFRPATGTLYALSSLNSASTGVAQLYTVNLGTGVLTTVGSTFSLLTGSNRISMDFNPVADRIRVISGTGNNLRLNPNDGSVVATDANLAYDPSDPSFGGAPLIADLAYTNNVAGASTTTAYGYDYDWDGIVRIGSVGGSPISPNSGTMFTVGPAFPTPTTFSASIGMDVSGNTGICYINADDGTSANADFLFSVNLGTGATTSLGGFGTTDMLDISAAPAPVPEPATMAVLGIGALAAIRRKSRK